MVSFFFYGTWNTSLLSIYEENTKEQKVKKINTKKEDKQQQQKKLKQSLKHSFYKTLQTKTQTEQRRMS